MISDQLMSKLEANWVFDFYFRFIYNESCTSTSKLYSLNEKISRAKLF